MHFFVPPPFAKIHSGVKARAICWRKNSSSLIDPGQFSSLTPYRLTHKRDHRAVLVGLDEGVELEVQEPGEVAVLLVLVGVCRRRGRQRRRESQPTGVVNLGHGRLLMLLLRLVLLVVLKLGLLVLVVAPVAQVFLKRQLEVRRLSDGRELGERLQRHRRPFAWILFNNIFSLLGRSRFCLPRLLNKSSTEVCQLYDNSIVSSKNF